VPLAVQTAISLRYSKNSFAAYCHSVRVKRCLAIVSTFVLLTPLAISSALADSVSKTAPWLAPEGGNPMALSVSSPSFASGAEIPKKFTCDGSDISPQLVWTEPPSGTKSFALLVDDPDAPAGNWNHWTLWNLPPTARGLPEAVGKDTTLPDGTQQGRNDFRKTGYNGPCPPPGKPHRYYFKLFALDATLDLKPGASKRELETAMKEHILAQAEWMGRYGR
jgi:Raf kinase inhibitor-like YbhB/YbcL family protein